MTHPFDDKNLINPSVLHWKKNLSEKMPSDWEKEINEYETELYLKKQGKIEDKVFAESRLRRGSYGQRYDHGQRHDGKETKKINFPNELTKGPMTLWDAPGMERIKIPYGGLNVKQLEVLADLGEEYSDGILHVTNRQDIQLHYVHIEDTPSLFRRLAAVGITTREACGNSVRNVTGCPYAGVCPDESFDTTGYADATFRFLLGHPDVQDFGRKFKISFSGCKNHPCALASMHDLGLIAVTKTENGKEKRGFEYYVGGGLGAVPQLAKLFDDFVPEEELLPLTQAVARIFARHGEKKNRNRSCIKFLVSDWGIDKFREAVLEERKKIKPDPRWNSFLEKINQFDETALRPPGEIKQIGTPDYLKWLQHNIRPQRQKGYSVVTLVLPLGDLTSNQARDLAGITRKFIKDTIRLTVEQNLVFRWVSNNDLPQLYEELKKINLAEPTAGSIVDITSCPGTDTCKLGISSSRGLSGELRKQLAEKNYQNDEVIGNLRIKVSGCFNSCGQHHIADMGFYGISRKVGSYIVPHFQLILGGQMQENAGAYGLPIVAIPSKAVPKAIERLTGMYVSERQGKENFQAFIKRLGKVEIKKRLEDLTQVPTHDEDPSYYVDWSDVREYTTSDIGKGECAGEMVSLVDFGLKAADRIVFEAQIDLDVGKFEDAGTKALQAMLTAAQGLIKDKNPDISDKPDEILAEFKTRFCDTEIFYDPFARDKFARYLFSFAEKGIVGLRPEQVRQRVEEATLFIEAAYSCNVRMSMQKAV